MLSLVVGLVDNEYKSVGSTVNRLKTVVNKLCFLSEENEYKEGLIL